MMAPTALRGPKAGAHSASFNVRAVPKGQAAASCLPGERGRTVQVDEDLWLG